MKNYKVYLIKDRSNNIVYCGLTGSELQVRFYGHVNRLGITRESHTIELVQEWLTLPEAAILEKMLIKQYDLLNVGLNKSPGSINGYSNNHSKEQKLKWVQERKNKPISKEHAAKNKIARLGKTNSEKHKQKVSEVKSKPVICLETGQVYKSARVAAKELNLQYSKISLVCNGIRSSTGNLHFQFYKK